ncbi:hypothetical protein OKHIF_11440 [Mycobacteroides chelonae]
MIASDIAVIKSGPASAEAITHRITYQEAVGAIVEATVRATPQTIAAVGNSGSTSMTRPPIEMGTRWVPSHMLATAPNVPVMSLLAITNCTKTIAAMTTNATADGPKATVSSARACAGLAREV